MLRRSVLLLVVLAGALVLVRTLLDDVEDTPVLPGSKAEADAETTASASPTLHGPPAPLAKRPTDGPALLVKVRDETGRPVQGAHVSVRRLTFFQEGESATDAHGHAYVRVDARRLSALYVRVSRDEGPAAHEWVSLPEDEAERSQVLERGIEITLQAGARLSGRAVDAQGAPVARAVVTLTGWDVRSTDGWLTPRVARTDGAGRFRCEGVEEGTHVLEVRSPAHVATAIELTLPASGTTVLADIVLHDAARIEGRVLGLAPRTEPRFVVATSLRSSGEAEAGRGVWHRLGDSATWFEGTRREELAPDATFVLAGLLPGPWSVRLEGPEEDTPRHPDVPVFTRQVVAAPARDVVLDLRRTLLRLEVRTAEYRISDAVVTLPGDPTVHLVTDEKGTATMLVPPQDWYDVTVHARGHTSRRVSFRSPDFGGERTQSIAMVRAPADAVDAVPDTGAGLGCTVEGPHGRLRARLRVVDASGARVDVTFEERGDGWWSTSPSKVGGHSEFGMVMVPHLPEGAYRLEAESDGHARGALEFTMPRDKPLVLRLVPE